MSQHICGLEKTNNAMNGDREKKTKMGERHHRYVRYDDNSKWTGIDFAETSGQRRPGEDTLSEEEGNQ